MALESSGVVLVICAPSGSGKTTLIKRLRKEFPQFGFSVSYTTRERREGEEHGKDYNFVSIQEFKEKRNAGFFAEWAHVHSSFYGTPLKKTLDMVKNGQSIIFDVDVQGASQLRLNLPSAVYIFIMPPSMEELQKRLEDRKFNTEEQIKQRITNAAFELQEAHWFDYWVVNDDLDRAYDQLRAAYIAASITPQNNAHALRIILDQVASLNSTEKN